MDSKSGWDLLLLLLLNKLRVNTGPLPVHYWTAVAITLIEDDWKLH
jgi:hypothetical protein